MAGENEGEITNCHVTIETDGSISARSNAGGVAGGNSDNISGCTVTIESGGSISAGDSSFSYAGSVVGYNTNNGIVDDNNEVEDNNDLKLPEIGNQPNQS